jgi:hypothetical protein
MIKSVSQVVTKSDQIRALAADKVPIAEIAKRLGIRYQHAYNVLRGSSAAKLAPRTKSAAPSKPKLKSDQLIGAGFDLTARWLKDKTGDLVLDGTLRREPGVYAFVNSDTALYVGVATMGLAKRLYFYRRPGSTQKTSVRIKALLLETLATVPQIDIYTATPPNSDWNGVPVSRVAGLEYGLIQTFYLAWNIRGAR